MNSQQPLRAPRVCQALVRVASWIAPAHARSEWRSRWDANLWGWWILYERGELTTRDHADLLRYSWGSFKDAFWLRISRENLKRSFRSASFVAAAGAMALLLMAAATHGFKGAQSLFAPLPVSDPDSLVLIQYTGAANEPFGVPPRLIPLWQAKARSLSGVAGYIGPARSPQATVTANFFSVLGVRPAIGRVFSQGEKDVAVLSGNAWHTMFNRDPGVIGKTVEISGSPFRIIGVLPESFLGDLAGY